MKECDIVRDLLVGYQDGTLHKTSKEFVEKHLEKCEDCKKIFDDMTKDKEELEKSQEKEIDYLKNVKKKMSKKNKIILIICIILEIIILLNVGIFIYYYKEAGKIQVYLENDITDEQISNIEKVVLDIDKNAKIEYISKDKALDGLKDKFEDKNLLSGYGGENNPLNSSYIIYTNIKDVDKIKTKLMSLEGIKNITSDFTNPYLFVFSKIVTK